VSCYDRIELATAAVDAGADYVAFGSAFASPTKPEAVRAAPELFAGHAPASGSDRCNRRITPENARLVIDAGADAIAVITALFDAADVRAARRVPRPFQHRKP